MVCYDVGMSRSPTLDKLRNTRIASRITSNPAGFNTWHEIVDQGPSAEYMEYEVDIECTMPDDDGDPHTEINTVVVDTDPENSCLVVCPGCGLEGWMQW